MDPATSFLDALALAGFQVAGAANVASAMVDEAAWTERSRGRAAAVSQRLTQVGWSDEE